MGLDCSPRGLSLAGVSLLRKDAGFSPRPTEEIEALIKAAYGQVVDPARLADGLDVVARALNSGDLGRAMIAALRLKLPNLDEAAAARLAGAEDMLAKYDPNEPRDERGRWTTGAAAGSTPGGASRPVQSRPTRTTSSRAQAPPRLTPASFETISDRVYPNVTAFRNQHLVDAVKLASFIGHGATTDEVLAVSGAENTWGTKKWAKKWGNFFGIHAKRDGSYFAGQIGLEHTHPQTGPSQPVPKFRTTDGFWWSGLAFANKMAAAAKQAGLGANAFADPRPFFTVAHPQGQGTTRLPDYVQYAMNCHELLRNSARASERPS